MRFKKFSNACLHRHAEPNKYGDYECRWMPIVIQKDHRPFATTHIHMLLGCNENSCGLWYLRNTLRNQRGGLAGKLISRLRKALPHHLVRSKLPMSDCCKSCKLWNNCTVIIELKEAMAEVVFHKTPAEFTTIDAESEDLFYQMRCQYYEER